MSMANWEIQARDNQRAADHISLPIPPESTAVEPETETDWRGEPLIDGLTYWFYAYRINDHRIFVLDDDDEVVDYLNETYSDVAVKNYADAIPLMESELFQRITINDQILRNIQMNY